MRTIEITSFAEVILFRMQQERQLVLTFADIWKCCERSHFGSPFQPSRFAKPFVGAIRSALRDLEGRGLITVVTKDEGEKVRHIAITRLGLELLQETIFSHQQRMGESA